MALLELDDVSVVYRARGRKQVRAVDHLTLDVEPDETFALIGESGSGKSTVSKAVLRLEPLETGTVRFDGESVHDASRRDLRRLRAGMQMIFQDPHSALDPRMRTLASVAEPAREAGVSKRDSVIRALELLERVGISPSMANRYPHQLSGGQKQRINIARALMLSPSLLICDEPVSALDVSLQAEILNLLLDLKRERSLSLLFITHDISLLPHLADRVGVMYLGRLVEVGSARQVVADPQHPYTQALVASVPELSAGRRAGDDAGPVRGEIPDPASPPPGCRFHPRCPYTFGDCLSIEPSLLAAADGRAVACHLVTGTAAQKQATGQPLRPPTLNTDPITAK